MEKASRAAFSAKPKDGIKSGLEIPLVREREFTEVIIMQMKTHLAVGAMLGLSLTATSPVEVAVIGLCSASTGAIICDMDVGECGRKSTPPLIGSISGGLFTLQLIVMLIFAPGMLFDTSGGWSIAFFILRLIMALLCVICICRYGMKKPHRSFLHSFLAILVLFGAACMINLLCGMFMAIGLISHLFLDLLNYRPVKLLYPSERGFSFKLCYSNSKVSDYILLASIIVSVGVVMYRIICLLYYKNIECLSIL